MEPCSSHGFPLFVCTETQAVCYFQILREHPHLMYFCERAGSHACLRITVNVDWGLHSYSLREDQQAPCLLQFLKLAKAASRHTHPSSGASSRRCVWLGRITSCKLLLGSLDTPGPAEMTLVFVMEHRQFNNIIFSWATTRTSSMFSDKISVQV